MAVSNNFAAVAKNRLDRNFGGSNSNYTADPYLTGYQFVKFFNFPREAIANLIVTGDSGPPKVASKKITRFLEANTFSVTPPGGTINRTEFTGLGGTKWSSPTNVDYGNTITLKFIEFSGTPVLQILHAWARLIRDYRNGAMPGNVNYNSKPSYTCNLLYWTTKPDCVSVEYAALYTGCHPNKDPQDSFSGDVETVDKLEIEVEFGIDYPWHEPWVYNKAAELAQEYKKEGHSNDQMSPKGNLA